MMSVSACSDGLPAEPAAMYIAKEETHLRMVVQWCRVCCLHNFSVLAAILPDMAIYNKTSTDSSR